MSCFFDSQCIISNPHQRRVIVIVLERAATSTASTALSSVISVQAEAISFFSAVFLIYDFLTHLHETSTLAD